MDEQPQFVDVFLDLLPNRPKNDKTREQFRQFLRKRFEDRLAESVERVWDLPPVMVKPQGDYLAMLMEARELYLAGHFYSCVAMCGIVGERLVKDVLRASILVQKDSTPQPPSDAAFDQLERVEISGIVRFLKEAGLLDEKATKATEKLGRLRNQYAHARGKAPQSDAHSALKHLHILVEDTVSIFREVEIKNGAFVRKSPP